MKEVINFCVAHYELIISAVLCLISVVIQLLKKRSTTNTIDTIKKDVLLVLPSLINSVEIDGHGTSKKQAVLDALEKLIKKRYKLDDVNFLHDFISDALEDILSTPTKKGD